MLQYSTINFKEIIHSDYLNEDILDLMNYTFEIPESYTYNIFEVTKEYIARPDLISLDAYGDGMFADIICKLNGVSNPFELNEGMKLIIPSPEDIMKFAIQPSLKDLDANWGGILSGKQTNITAKNTKSKRKPNEAILGDIRFKIDKNSGIIIY
jgi:hypothetical protein